MKESHGKMRGHYEETLGFFMPDARRGCLLEFLNNRFVLRAMAALDAKNVK